MPDNYFARYLPLLIHVCIALGIATGMILLSTILGKRRASRAKFQQYECGIAPTGDAGGHALHPFRCRGYLPLSLGGGFSRPQQELRHVRLLGNGGLHRHCAGWLLLHLEEGRARLEPPRRERRLKVPALVAPITDLEQLKEHAALGSLLNWNSGAVQGAAFDRNELTVYIDRAYIREACALLKSKAGLNFFSDLTCVDWHPSEPRFEVIYHLLSHGRKERVRLKVKLMGDDASLETITGLWP